MEYYDVYNQDYVEVAMREDKHPVTKIEVLDHTEYVIYDVSDDIVVGSDKVDISYNQGTQAKMSFDIINVDNKYLPNEDSPFWYGTKLKVYKGLKDMTNGDVYLFSKGIYVVDGVTSDGDTVSVSATDKFGAISSDVGSSNLECSTKIELGDTVSGMLNDIMSMDMGNGKPLDPASIIVDANAKDIELGQDVEMGVGTYVGDLLIELANSIRCRIFYDLAGHLRFAPTGYDAQYQNKAPIWTFDDEKTAEYLSTSVDYDFPSVKNRITVWGESMDGITYTRTIENDNPKSPVRISKVGYRVADTMENLYGYEQANVDAFAEMYLQMKSIQGMSVKIDSTMLPHLNVEDVVQVKNKKFDFDNKRFLVSGINYSGDQMTISLCNLDVLPAFTEIQ